MKTLKPQCLGVLHRTFDNDGACHFAPAVLVYFDYDKPGRPLHEVNMWKAVAEELGSNTPLDECMPKPEPEVLVDGYAYPPGDTPQPACKVRLQFAEQVDKTLYVVGERRWKHGVATDPQPFSEMRVNWDNAFGGEGFDQNPRGKGVAPIEVDGEKVHPLPNVEWPKKLVGSPNDKPQPAGFGYFELTWPQRYQHRGTYDDRWLKERFPGFPEDFDFHFFNVAPEDQRLKQPLVGNERFVVENMHPEQREVEGGLPAVQVRCFINVQRAGVAELELREVPMKPETVRLFPHLKRGILIFRGVTEVAEDDAADVKQLLVAAEDMGQSRPRSYYARVLEQRLDKDKGYLYALRDRDLLPDTWAQANPADDELIEGAELFELDSLMADNVRRGAQRKLDKLRENMIAQGMDPDEHGVPLAIPPPEDKPRLDDLPAYVEEQLAEVDKHRAEAEQKAKTARDEARKKCAEHGIDYDEVIANALQESAGPPKFRAHKEIERLNDQLQLARNAGVELPEVDKKLADPKLLSDLQNVEDKLFYAYRRFGHQQIAAARLDGDEGSRVRETVIALHAAGESLAERDLTGADLSGLDLFGADLRGSFLESANLAGSDLRGADLTDAMLAHANLTGAKLSGATITRTNFGAATLRDADLSDTVDASAAVFANASLVGTSLRGAKLADADFLEASFEDTDLSGAEGTQINFLMSSLHRTSFRGAKLTKCNFIQMSGDDVDFSEATLDETVFISAEMPQINFRNASLANFRVVNESAFPAADFQGANMPESNLRGTDLRGANFSGAQLDKSDFSECNLQGATFYRARATNSLWIRSDLKGANMVCINAMLAIMQKANIEGADFRGANLFRVDFARIKGDDATLFQDANMKEIRFVARPGQAGILPAQGGPAQGGPAQGGPAPGSPAPGGEHGSD